MVRVKINKHAFEIALSKKNLSQRDLAELIGFSRSHVSYIINGRREIMYSDIINLIIRKGYIGKKYNLLILWCNYKIRIGKTFVELE